MSAPEERYSDALESAARHARRWLESQETRHVGPRVTAADLASAFGCPLPAAGCRRRRWWTTWPRRPNLGSWPCPPDGSSAGSSAAPCRPRWPRTGWSARGTRTPDCVRHTRDRGIEEAAGAWLLELLGLPEEADVGFATGATMANFTGLAAARWRLMADAGWDSTSTASPASPDPLLRGPGTARHHRPRPAVSGAGPAHGGPRRPAGPHRPVGAGPGPGRRR